MVVFPQVFSDDVLKTVCRFRNDVQLVPTDKIRMESGPKNGGVAASLTFEPVSMDDIGEIKAVAKNPAGEATAVAKLNVLGRFHC